MASTELVPQNGKGVVLGGRGLPHGYPFDVVGLALVCCLETRSVAEGHRKLRRELEVHGQAAPDVRTVLNWVRASEQCYSAVTGSDKREMVALASDAARSWALRSLEAADARNWDGKYAVSHRESAYHYGIAMQRRTDWDRVGQAGPSTAIQINITDSKGESIGEV